MQPKHLNTLNLYFSPNTLIYTKRTYILKIHVFFFLISPSIYITGGGGGESLFHSHSPSKLYANFQFNVN